MDIDRKFIITAVSRNNGETYTQEDGVFFKSGDAAFNRAVLDTYKRELIKLGAHPRQLEAVDLLMDRVEKYRGLNPAKVKIPDVDAGDEAARVNAPNE